MMNGYPVTFFACEPLPSASWFQALIAVLYLIGGFYFLGHPLECRFALRQRF
jgi:hypothetical protein